MPARYLGEEWHCHAHDVDVEPMSGVELGPRPGEVPQLFLDGSRQLRRFQDVTVLGPAYVLGLHHQRGGPDDLKAQLRARSTVPPTVEVPEEVLNDRHEQLSAPQRSPPARCWWRCPIAPRSTTTPPRRHPASVWFESAGRGCLEVGN